VIFRSARVSAAELERETGWALKPEGLCRDDRCVPFASSSTEAIDLADAASALGMPLVAEPRSGLWALGPEAGGKALATVTLPEIELPDVDGRPFRLASLRGTKVLLVAWASW
jgi:hypothetical protein